MQYRLKDILIGILGLGIMVQLAGCSNGLKNEGNVIFTLAPPGAVDLITSSNYEHRYAGGYEIVRIDFEHSKNIKEILTEDFYSAKSPDVFFDATQMVFSGQKNNGEAWQIWILDFENDKIFQVTSGKNNCTDPAWLPDGRIVFSKNINENGLEHHALYTIAADGCCEQRISFQPHEDLNATVLHDGRILFSSQQIYPVRADTKYIVMRPDGTKAELFHLSESKATLSKAVETEDDVFFTQSGSLKMVKFNRPLHTLKSIDDLKNISVQSVFPISATSILASVKKESGSILGLAIFNLVTKQLEDVYLSEDGFHAMDPVIAKRKPIPRKLPSRVNVEKETGYFVCMDASESEMESLFEAGETTRIQVLGVNDILGETETAEDGSFYLEVKADQPVRFQTLNNQGEIVRGPSSWMWVRPNERRGCVGCHEDREMAPENVVPKAMEKAPVAMIK